MPTSVKVSALLTIGLAILFFFFFDNSKHAPVLSQVNAFAEDPYDSVGSFAVQLAPFFALVAILRAFRPYPSEKIRDRQLVLFARAAYFSCLAVYPEELRQSVAGEILTIAVGLIFLFVLVWALGTAITPSFDPPFEDVIDDLVIAYQWEKARFNPSDPLFAFDPVLEKLLTPPAVRSILHWLNPRRHPWNIVILLGLFIGITLLLTEMIGEGGPPQLGRLAMIAAIFIGVECGGVLLGYVLLAKPAGLFRSNTQP